MTYSNVLLMLIPPAAGAVIGYLTNAVAIRMLFRPLRAYHIGKLRVPFTPGIIPRQRERLAESIARMVGQTLLTPESLLGHLQQPEMRIAINGYVSRITGSVFNIQERILNDSAESRSDRSSDLPGKLIEDLLLSPAFSELLSFFSRQMSAAAMDLRIGSLMPRQSPEVLQEFVRSYLSKRDSQAFFRRGLKKILKNLRKVDRPVRDFIPGEFTDDIIQILDDQYDPVWSRILTWLKKEEIQQELSSRGRVLLQRILKRLGSFQRFFVSAGQYDRNLDEQMPSIVRDLIQQLEYSIALPETRRLILLEARILIEECISCSPVELEKKLAVNFPRAIDTWLKNFFSGTSSIDIREGIGQIVAQLSASIADLHVSDVLHHYLSVDPEMISSLLKRKLESYLGLDFESEKERRERVQHRLAQWKTWLIKRFTQNVDARRELISAGQKRMIDEYVTESFYRIMENRLPDLVDSVDFQSLVKNKVNSLDMLQVEQLLLMVMQKHLKYINIFGAFLGALIGAGQVVLLQFM
ncbi:DUF445 family protein [Spirochaeta dissipatitropha]